MLKVHSFTQLLLCMRTQQYFAGEASFQIPGPVLWVKFTGCLGGHETISVHGMWLRRDRDSLSGPFFPGKYPSFDSRDKEQVQTQAHQDIFHTALK